MKGEIPVALSLNWVYFSIGVGRSGTKWNGTERDEMCYNELQRDETMSLSNRCGSPGHATGVRVLLRNPLRNHLHNPLRNQRRRFNVQRGTEAEKETSSR